MMKRIILCVLLALCIGELIATVVSAADKKENITLYWDWSGPVPPEATDLAWKLFMRGEGESYDYDNPVLVVPYADKTELTGDITIEGDMGQTVRKYFVLRAYYDGEDSGDSNEPFRDFVIPYSPYNLTITVNIQASPP